MTTFYVALILYMIFSCCGICRADSDFESVFSEIADATLAEGGKLNFTQIATKYGHNAEQYDVTTEDGYILTIFCLRGDVPSVLLFHGLLDSSDTFIIRGNTSLAITLANAGYTVWLGNSRGNKFGRRHITLNPDTDKKFWDYSLHEYGYFDLAATVDYICDKTGEDSIAVIGHSEGNTAHFVLGSTRPEYNEKIKVIIAMGPSAFFNNVTPPRSNVASVVLPPIFLFLESLGVEELFRDRKAASNLIKLFCSKGIVSYAICSFGLLFPLAGFDPGNIEPEFLKVLIGHVPSATSRKSLVHYDQIYLRKRFGQYDYGVTKNMVKYGTASPPDYDLSAVTMKVAILVGKNDLLGTEKDAEHLRDCLPNVVHYELLEPKLWSHLDFVWAKDMPKYLFPSIFKILKENI